MFYFFACIATVTGGVNCTAPVAIERESLCRPMDEAYRAAAQELYRTIAVTTRCIPASAQASMPSERKPEITIPEIKLP